MSFSKYGMLKTAKIEVLENTNDWETIRKQAKTLPEEKKEEEVKEADFQVVATIDPEKFVYIHTTIMAGVKTCSNGYWITPETEKYINDNHDAWTCEDLLNDCKSFKRATTFVEHDQRLEQAKGKCIDVVARDMGDTILIDVLFSVDRRHKDLVANIENGIINAVSMGCTTAQTICSICGNVASSPETYCEHLKRGNKGSFFKVEGASRKSAEICKSNTFFDVSLVANPAFAGAIFRKILSPEDNKKILSALLSSKIEAVHKDNDILLKAASKECDAVTVSIKQNGKIEIITPKQSFISEETLDKEEIEKICSFVTKAQKPLVEKVFEKLFGKKQVSHPIENESGNKDFSISDSDYSDIPYRDRFKAFENVNTESQNLPILDLKPKVYILDINPKNLDTVMSRVEGFECLKCGFKSDLWKIKASSIDSGKTTSLECPRCFYIAEETIYKDSSKSKLKAGDKVKITTGKGKDKTGEIIGKKGPLFIIKLKDKSVVMKFEKDIKLSTEKQARVFIASQDIFVENDEGTFWFDEQGNSVITKGEKVSFVTDVDNGKYGLFTTETGEDFFMPMCHVNAKG
ncbi:MAG: hypothetical protein PHF86_07455 [Candidatus Nanoarchaeia archaeon]|nr:hypothetical protein [Candidatus Nanoarchaeia archaeon]